MALHSKKDFAEMCGMPTKNLATYVGRGQVFVDDKGFIDDKNPANKTFLHKRMGRKTEQQLVKEIAQSGISPTAVDSSPEDTPKDYHTKRLKAQMSGEEPTQSDGVPDLYTSTKLLKHLDTQKREKEISLLHIKEEKLRGEMVPSALIEPILLQHNQSILTHFQVASENFLRIFSQKKGLTNEERVEVKAQFVVEINSAIEKAVNMTISSLSAVIGNFIETKGKGERE